MDEPIPAPTVTFTDPESGEVRTLTLVDAQNLLEALSNAINEAAVKGAEHG